MVTLEEHFKNEKQLEQTLVSVTTKDNEVDVTDFLWSKNLVFAVYELEQKQITLAKQHFYLCGRLDELRVKKYNSRIFDHGIKNVCCAILSDNKDLIDRYSQLRYRGDGKNYPDMDTMVKEGELPIWCHTLFMIIKDDWKSVEQNLSTIEKVTFSKFPKNVTSMRLDWQFYKAIMEKDKKAAEAILQNLLQPEMHKRRNDNPLLSQYISIPALGYAKLAWMKGIEVEVDSPLLPRDLLPITPNEKYEDTYEFLKNI